ARCGWARATRPPAGTCATTPTWPASSTVSCAHGSPSPATNRRPSPLPPSPPSGGWPPCTGGRPPATKKGTVRGCRPPARPGRLGPWPARLGRLAAAGRRPRPPPPTELTNPVKAASNQERTDVDLGLDRDLDRAGVRVAAGPRRHHPRLRCRTARRAPR